jgi:hypothetical protein
MLLFLPVGLRFGCLKSLMCNRFLSITPDSLFLFGKTHQQLAIQWQMSGKARILGL